MVHGFLLYIENMTLNRIIHFSFLIQKVLGFFFPISEIAFQYQINA